MLSTAHLILNISSPFWVSRDILYGQEQQNPGPVAHPIYCVFSFGTMLSFLHTNQIREWLSLKQQFLNWLSVAVFNFPKPHRGVFLVMEVEGDCQPYTRENLLRAMDLACDDMAVDAFQGWIQHARTFFPHCLERDNIACNVNEVLWPKT